MRFVCLANTPHNYCENEEKWPILPPWECLTNILTIRTQVDWDGPDDPDDPYNWSKKRKIPIGIIISLSQLVCLMTTSVVAPALPQIASDLNLGESKAQIAFSIFVLGQAFGPFVIAPLSEVFGRKPVWIACNIFYIFWNTMCPVGKSKAVMMIGRLLSGAGGSCGVVVSFPFTPALLW